MRKTFFGDIYYTYILEKGWYKHVECVQVLLKGGEGMILKVEGEGYREEQQQEQNKMLVK